MRKPYFWKSRNAWYINHEGTKLRLSEDEKEAHEKWARMLELGKYQNADATIYALIVAWLDHFESELSVEKYKDAVRVLKSFHESVGQSQIARDLTSAQVRKWLDSKDWSQSRKSDALSKLKRVIVWAFNEGWIPKNPLHMLRIPKGKPREQLVETGNHERMIEACKGSKRWRTFIPFLVLIHLTGARPITIRTLTRKNVSKDYKRWVFAEHKTAGKTGKPLIVNLSACAQTMTKILASRRNGTLILNWEGQPFSKNAIVHRMASLRKRLGIKEVAYSYRHTYATDALLSGESASIVASLLGHVDSAMVNKVYGHLEQCELGEMAERVAKKRSRVQDREG